MQELSNFELSIIQQQGQQHFRSVSPDNITYPYPLCKSEEERLKAMSLKPNQVRICLVFIGFLVILKEFLIGLILLHLLKQHPSKSIVILTLRYFNIINLEYKT